MLSENTARHGRASIDAPLIYVSTIIGFYPLVVKLANIFSNSLYLLTVTNL